MNAEVNHQETDKITLKDIYEILLLWSHSGFLHNLQCSLFLMVFLVVFFIGYGIIVFKLCSGIPYGDTLVLYNIINVTGIVIAFLGFTFSLLWYLLWKRSGGLCAKHEEVVSNQEEEKQENSSPTENNKNESNNGISTAKRISIAIGKILMIIWCVVLVSHIILYILTSRNVIAFTPTSSFWILAMIGIIFALPIILVVFKLHKRLKSKKKTADSKNQIWNFKLINDNVLLNVIIWIFILLIAYVLGFISRTNKHYEDMSQYSLVKKDSIVYQVQTIKVDTITIDPSSLSEE